MSDWIAADGGQSATRIRTSWSDAVIDGPGFVHDADRGLAVARTIIAALPPLEGRPIDVVATGHTGLPVDAVDRQRVAALVAEATGARSVLLTPDWVTAHLGAFEGGPGVVVAAGTGAVALGVAAVGTARRVDGAGYLVGDAGSGFWIGRRGLEVALRTIDGRASSPALLAAARAHFGEDLPRAAWDLYASAQAVDTIARFAPAVIEADDPDALAIVGQAASELAATVAAAAEVIQGARVEVAVTGRLLGADNELARRFVGALTLALPRSELRAAAGDSLDGAVRLATQGPGIHASLIHTYPGDQEPS